MTCCCGDEAEGDCADALKPVRLCQKFYGGSDATDLVAAGALDKFLRSLVRRVNDQSAALAQILRGDCTLKDDIIRCRHFATDVGVDCLSGDPVAADYEPSPLPAVEEGGVHVSTNKHPDYDGFCMRVRRDSDDAETDIPFLGDWLDTGFLQSFCAGSQGFVRTWYSQTGVAQDLEQATHGSQPAVTDASGVPYTDGEGRPTVYFDDSHMDTPLVLGVRPYRVWLAIASIDVVVTKARLMGTVSSSNYFAELQDGEPHDMTITGGGGTKNAADFSYRNELFCLSYSPTETLDNWNIYKNGAAQASGLPNALTPWVNSVGRLGNAAAGGGNDAWYGYVSEFYLNMLNASDDAAAAKYSLDRALSWGII